MMQHRVMQLLIFTIGHVQHSRNRQMHLLQTVKNQTVIVVTYTPAKNLIFHLPPSLPLRRLKLSLLVWAQGNNHNNLKLVSFKRATYPNRKPPFLVPNLLLNKQYLMALVCEFGIYQKRPRARQVILLSKITNINIHIKNRRKEKDRERSYSFIFGKNLTYLEKREQKRVCCLRDHQLCLQRQNLFFDQNCVVQGNVIKKLKKLQYFVLLLQYQYQKNNVHLFMKKSTLRKNYFFTQIRLIFIRFKKMFQMFGYV
eukprot:TRINITY_DN1918_c0_g1_i12.p3 TRINITY_DN1918_c0_g1~~TRINITY_DN1918_c0_g1_i12.p3  ORF type:complete len:255 (+),score=-18.38 TRINITY_DN1918_c0_g1_i12:2008-2772(+)